MAKRPDYKKIAGRGLAPGSKIAAEMVTSSRPSKPPAQRSILDYKTPADASGKGQIGLNMASMGRLKPKTPTKAGRKK